MSATKFKEEPIFAEMILEAIRETQVKIPAVIESHGFLFNLMDDEDVAMALDVFGSNVELDMNEFYDFDNEEFDVTDETGEVLR